MKPIPVLALLLVVPQLLHAEEDLFASPLRLFQEALVPVLQGNERGVVRTTWRGFRLRADAQQKIEQKRPSGVGIELNVAVRDADEIPKYTDVLGMEEGLLTRTVSYPAPAPEAPQGLVVMLRHGPDAPEQSLRVLRRVLDTIRNRLTLAPAGGSARWGKPSEFEPGEEFRTILFPSRVEGPVTKYVAAEFRACKVLRILGHRALVWTEASPQTAATPTVVAGLHLLVMEEGKWRLATSKRFEATGKNAGARVLAETDKRAGPHVTVTLEQGGRGYHYAQSATYAVRGNDLTLALPEEKRLR